MNWSYRHCWLDRAHSAPRKMSVTFSSLKLKRETLYYTGSKSIIAPHSWSRSFWSRVQLMNKCDTGSFADVLQKSQVSSWPSSPMVSKLTSWYMLRLWLKFLLATWYRWNGWIKGCTRWNLDTSPFSSSPRWCIASCLVSTASATIAFHARLSGKKPSNM